MSGKKLFLVQVRVYHVKKRIKGSEVCYAKLGKWCSSNFCRIFTFVRPIVRRLEESFRGIWRQKRKKNLKRQILFPFNKVLFLLSVWLPWVQLRVRDRSERSERTSSSACLITLRWFFPSFKEIIIRYIGLCQC